jgi:hypothetical protein
MGTMSASDAAPLPRLGEVFFDVRGDSRTMRVSWYADTGVAVFSIWQGDTCTGTFRLPIPELPRMVEALTKGPPGHARSGSRAGGPGLGQADPGASTAAMGPGQDSSAQHGYGAPDAGYGAAVPAGYQDAPPTAGYGAAEPAGHQNGLPTAGYTGTGPGGYQEPAAGGRHQMPADGYYQEPAAEGRHDLPPGGYYQGSAPEGQRDLPPAGHARPAAGGYSGGGYQDPPGSYGGSAAATPDGYQDLPPGSYEGSAAPGGYQDLPPGGYRDLLPGGYGDAPRGDGHSAPGDGYREPPAASPLGGPAHFAGGQQDSYPPTGPLPVGRWRTEEPSGGEFPQARPGDGFAPDRFAEDGLPAERCPAGGFAPDEYARDEYAPDEYARDEYAPDEHARDEYAPDEYAGDGFAQDGFADDGYRDDPLAGSYQGEAEQGYLPSPPTDMFPAASLSGGYHGQGDHRAGYEPDPADLDHESPYPAGQAGRGGPPRDLGAYHPGRGGGREREYGHSRDRS